MRGSNFFRAGRGVRKGRPPSGTRSPLLRPRTGCPRRQRPKKMRNFAACPPGWGSQLYALDEQMLRTLISLLRSSRKSSTT
mmetsp:Transcript_30372/g.60068  ORF Transcript_30372/g.60068 Transcript_30372/m.60068 type:complete len:81 (-) Transcript_30372:506-748(-)